uniref:uncharacterized protein LOC113475666 n=1 Tax=Ciona intestinalis TaxID=7719 RepID=UPI000EF4D682|nr:uncharacterized protein LOC113475666 [Ciona intestinalis]|eukprot:XP_026695920.1 uncharacterized protein LOC113475666 [Ciona intestinalis]
MEQKFVQYLLDWKTEVDVLYTGEEKRILARNTLQGLVFTSLNLVALAKRLLDDRPKNGLKYVCLGTFTQDVLEATFGNLRNSMRRNTNPNISRIGYGITAISQRKAIKQIKGGNTTYGTKNAWTSVCNEPLVKKVILCWVMPQH